MFSLPNLGGADEQVVDEGVEDLPNGGVRVTLRHPVDVQPSRRTVTHIELRRPTGKDMRKLPASSDAKPASPGEYLSFFGALIVGESAALIDALDLEDIGRLGGAMQRFFPRGPKTGESE